MLFLLLISALTYAFIARGYVMHTSCEYMKNDLENNIQKAFLSADDVSIQLASKLIDSDVENIAELAYGIKEGQKGWEGVPESILRLQNLRNRIEFDDFMKDPLSWSRQVVIYCDFKHVVPITYMDHITQNSISGFTDPWYFYSSDDKLYKTCDNDNPPIGPEAIIGYTTLQDVEYTESINGTQIKDGPSQVTKPDVLHLCAWYLKRAGLKQFLDTKDAQGKASRAVIDAVKFSGNKTQVDILSGFSQFLLREFSHSRNFARGAADDGLNSKEVPRPGWVETIQSQRLNNTYNLGYLGIGVQTVLKSRFKITENGSVVLKVQASGIIPSSGSALATGVSRVKPRWQPKQADWQRQRAG